MLEDNKNYNMPFPSRLRMLLDETGASQQEVADYVGVKRQTIAQWKDGKTLPDIHNFQKIAQFFAVPYEFLLGDTSSRVRENLHLENSLGLSDGAIEVLKSFCSAETTKAEKDTLFPLSQVLSNLIQNHHFAGAIRHFQECLYESSLKTVREYDDKHSEKVLQEINAAMAFLREVGIAVIDADTMKSYHLELAKTALQRAMEDIEQTMAVERLRKITSFMEENANKDDFDDRMHEFLRREFFNGNCEQSG